MSTTPCLKPVLTEVIGPELLTVLLHARLQQTSDPQVTGVLYFSLDTLIFTSPLQEELEIWEKSIAVRELVRELTFKMQTLAAELIPNVYLDEDLPNAVGMAAAGMAQRILANDSTYAPYLQGETDATGQPLSLVQMRLVYSVARPPVTGPAIWRKHPAIVVFVVETVAYTADPDNQEDVVLTAAIESYNTVDFSH